MRRLLSIAFIVLLLGGSLVAGGHEHAHESPAACTVCTLWQPALTAQPAKIPPAAAQWAVAITAGYRPPPSDGRALFQLAPKVSPPALA